MIEMAPWGDDSATIEKQIMSHNKTHSSVQRSQEVGRARDELVSGLRAILSYSFKCSGLMFML